MPYPQLSLVGEVQELTLDRRHAATDREVRTDEEHLWPPGTDLPRHDPVAGRSATPSSRGGSICSRTSSGRKPSKRTCSSAKALNR